MSRYSSPEEIAELIAKVTAGANARPSFINDLDGNVMCGFSLAAGQRLPLGPRDNPKNQAISFGTTPAQISELVRQGVLVKGIFAEKAMDARLPPELVTPVNESLREGRLFDIAFLTSRAAADAIILLAESGVDHPEHVTLIADSGATLYINGTKHEVRKLSQAEAAFLDRIDVGADALKGKVQAILTEMGFDGARCPDLYIEPKGIAKNVHYREVLSAYGQPDGSELDQRIGALVKVELERLVQEGPREANGSPTFKALDGPATVEVKVAGVNKGHGLQAFIEAAMRSSIPPTAVIFTGDDVSKGNGTPGTDYFAMVRAQELFTLYRIPVYNIHTHHPHEGKLEGTEPDERLSAATLSEQYPAPNIDLRLPTPAALADVIIRTHAVAHQKR